MMIFQFQQSCLWLLYLILQWERDFEKSWFWFPFLDFGVMPDNSWSPIIVSLAKNHSFKMMPCLWKMIRGMWLWFWFISSLCDLKNHKHKNKECKRTRNSPQKRLKETIFRHPMLQEKQRKTFKRWLILKEERECRLILLLLGLDWDRSLIQGRRRSPTRIFTMNPFLESSSFCHESLPWFLFPFGVTHSFRSPLTSAIETSIHKRRMKKRRSNTGNLSIPFLLHWHTLVRENTILYLFGHQVQSSSFLVHQRFLLLHAQRYKWLPSCVSEYSSFELKRRDRESSEVVVHRTEIVGHLYCFFFLHPCCWWNKFINFRRMLHLPSLFHDHLCKRGLSFA